MAESSIVGLGTRQRFRIENNDAFQLMHSEFVKMVGGEERGIEKKDVD